MPPSHIKQTLGFIFSLKLYSYLNSHFDSPKNSTKKTGWGIGMDCCYSYSTTTTSCVKTLTVLTSTFRFRSRSGSRPRLLLLRHRLPFLSLSLSTSSLSENGSRSCLLNGVGAGVGHVDSQNKLLQVVLVSPQIPGNTGCITRSCAASAVGLHLVGPLGFQVDDAKLKRAGLDYWPYVVVKVHDSWMEFRKYFIQQEGNKRLLAFTKRGTSIHSDFSYRKGDWLVFGSETSGLPPEALVDCKNEPLGGGALRIPMVETYVRCLNLSVSVGIALYEASRQLNYEQLESAPETCTQSENQLVVEDIFA